MKISSKNSNVNEEKKEKKKSTESSDWVYMSQQVA